MQTNLPALLVQFSSVFYYLEHSQWCSAMAFFTNKTSLSFLIALLELQDLSIKSIPIFLFDVHKAEMVSFTVVISTMFSYV